MFTSTETLDLSRGFYWKKETLDEFIRFVNKDNRHYERVLDAGCGVGFLTEILAANLDASSIIGVDVNPASIEIANKRKEECEQKDKITYQAGDLLSIDYKDGYFDLVFAHYLLIDTQNADIVLSQLLRVAKPGGVLCCIEPIYQTDFLNSYSPCIPAERQIKLKNIYKKMLIDIPGSMGIDRAIAPSLPKRFNDLGIGNIEIKVHGNYSFSYDYDQKTLEMMHMQSQQAIAQQGMMKQLFKQHPILENLSDSDLDEYVEAQIMISELIVEDPQKFAQMGMFTAGFNLMIRGDTPSLTGEEV